MTKGLFVTRWYGGTTSQKDCDQMLSFCDKNEIDDIYLSCHEDQSTFDKQFDYMNYILANKGTKRVLAWVSTTVGRERENNWTKNRMASLGLKTIKINSDWGVRLKLDLKDPKTSAHFSKRISDLQANYPSLDGVHIEGTPPNGKIVYSYGYTIDKNAELISAVEALGQKPILYCYGKLSADTKL